MEPIEIIAQTFEMKLFSQGIHTKVIIYPPMKVRIFL